MLSRANIFTLFLKFVEKANGILNFRELSDRSFRTHWHLNTKLQNLWLMPFLFLLTPTYVASQTIPNDFERYGSFIKFSEVPNVLFLLGEISSGDSFELRRAIRSNDVELIVTSSPGGHVFEALQISGIVSDNNISTFVPENGDCSSACSFIFLAGDSRIASGNLGVHQFYTSEKPTTSQPNTEETMIVSQFTTSEIIGFLNQYETPPFVYEKMFSTSSMYYFNEDELALIERSSSDEELLNLFDYANEKITEIFDGFLSDQSSLNDAEGAEVPNIPPPSDLSISIKTEIIRLQQELSRLGCNPGQADGIIGPATLRAIQRFFRHANIEYDPAKIDPTYIVDLAANKPSDFCPPPPVEPIPVLVGTWRTNAICPNIVLDGQIKLTRLPNNNDINRYDAEYRTGNLVFAGIVNQDKMTVSFRVDLIQGNIRGSSTIYGEGSIKTSNIIYLKSSDNCEIVALRI